MFRGGEVGVVQAGRRDEGPGTKTIGNLGVKSSKVVQRRFPFEGGEPWRRALGIVKGHDIVRRKAPVLPELERTGSGGSLG